MMATTPFRSVAMVFVGAFIGSFGAVFLKSGSERLRQGFRHILNWRLAAGVALFVLSSLFFVEGIRVGELSVLYPMVSLGYIWTLLWSRLFFGEPLTKGKFVGLFLIVVGVFFVGLGSR